jgi:hydroxymethylpyrimidine/phosphomethylpyrimidine kinase
VALTVAGSDSGAGAGVAADLKTFESHGVWGALALTAVTAQNTMGVQRASILDAELVVAQIISVVTDLGVRAAKTGMLGNAEVVAAVAAIMRAHEVGPLVVDPVMATSHGEPLLDLAGVDALRRDLASLATVITPNLEEASVLSGQEVLSRDGMLKAAETIGAMGPRVVMVTGGHLPDSARCPDLVWDRGRAQWLDGPRLDVTHSHGTGCVLSAAITAHLALGASPADACAAAKEFVTRAIEAGMALGRGAGPVDPGWVRGAGRD